MNGKTIQEMQKIYDEILQQTLSGFSVEEICEDLELEEESVRLIIDSPIMQAKLEMEKRKRIEFEKETKELVSQIEKVDEVEMPEIDSLTLVEKSQKDAIKTLIMEMKMADKSENRIRAAQSLIEIHRKSSATNMTQTLMDKNEISTLRNILRDYKEFHKNQKDIKMPQLKIPDSAIKILDSSDEPPQLPQSV